MENIENLTIDQLKEELKKLGKSEDDFKSFKKKAEYVELLKSLTSEKAEGQINLEELDKGQLLELLKSQDKVIDELKAINNKKGVPGKVTTVHKGKTYLFVSPKFILPAFGETIPGKEYTAEEAAENPEVIAQLIKRKSGILKEVK